MTTRYAVVGPYAATWLLSQMRAGGSVPIGQRVRSHSLWLRQSGRADLADEVEAAYGQLQAAAQEHRACHDEAVASRLLPRAEVREAAAAEAESESEVTARAGLSTHSAGTALGVSARAVRSMCESGQLSARKVGREWLIEAESVRALADLRRSA